MSSSTPSTRGDCRTIGRGRWVLLGLVAGLLAAALLPAGAGAQSASRAGDAVLIDQGGAVLSNGGSATVFQFRLPEGAACQGDTKHDGYLLQGFIIPGSDDPGSLRFMEIKPDGDGQWGLYAEDTTPFTQRPTAIADAAGQPGLVNGLPSASFAVFPPGTLPDGTYRIGVACSLDAQTTRYWDAAFAVKNTTADQPGQFRWSVDGSTPSSGGSNSARSVVVAIVIVAILAVAVFIIVRNSRRGRQRPLIEEMT